MPKLNAIKSRLKAGLRFSLFGFVLEIHVRRFQAGKQSALAALENHVRHVALQFPLLERMYLSSSVWNMDQLASFLDFCNDYIPLVLEQARETQVRRLLVRLNQRIGSDDFQAQIEIEMARSNLRSGVVDRADCLNSNNDQDAQAVKEGVLRHNERSGATAEPIGVGWPNASRELAMRWLFEQNSEQLRNKSVLHFAPEPLVQRWFKEHLVELCLEDYHTLYPFSAGVDLADDITCLDIPADRYDFIICHRVLEHIPDDRAALKEMFRVLKPGGILNFSVPESLNLDHTNEWVIQDISHDEHVRQYGADLVDILRSAGFEVQLEESLLKKSRSEHLKHFTYPMRIFRLSKPS